MNAKKSNKKQINKIPEVKSVEISEYHPFRSAEAKEQYIAVTDEFAKLWWPNDSKSRYIKTSFGKTFVRISGPENAPPLVLLPGMYASSLMWYGYIKALSKTYNTYAVDTIYDYGRSIYTRVIKSPDEYVNWLDELFTSLDLGDNINLMGMSYGGWLVSQYALRFPNRLNKIVLLAPAATILPLRLQFYVRGALMYFIPFRCFRENYFSWLFEDLVKHDESLFKKWMDEEIWALQRFKPIQSMVRPTVLDDKELQSIKVPTLYLVGENERIYFAHKAVQRIDRVAPFIKTEIIPDAGHDLLAVQAELVNRRVLEFLKQ